MDGVQIMVYGYLAIGFGVIIIGIVDTIIQDWKHRGPRH